MAQGRQMTAPAVTWHCILSVPAPWVWRSGEALARVCGANGRAARRGAAVGEKGRVNLLSVVYRIH